MINLTQENVEQLIEMINSGDSFKMHLATTFLTMKLEEL